MNTKIIAVMLIALVSMIGATSAEPTVTEYEGEYEYTGPDENLEVTADWDYTVTERRRTTTIEGEANAYVEYTYVNEEDYQEFIGANGHIEGKAKINNRNGMVKKADIYVNGNIYIGYEDVEHVEAVSYYDEATGHRVTVSGYQVVERYEQGYEFDGYLKVRRYRVRPASYFTWTPYEQHTWEEMNKVVTSNYRDRDSLETGIIAYMGLPEGTPVDAYSRTSTANGGAGITMIVTVPAYTVGKEPWSAINVDRPHKSVVKQNE